MSLAETICLHCVTAEQWNVLFPTFRFCVREYQLHVAFS